MKINDVGYFILSHKRSKNVKTIETLKKLGSSNDLHIVVDDMDEEKDIYVSKYENVHVFSKKSVIFDRMTNAENWNSPAYARNYIYKLAAEMGYKYGVMLDDDISDITIRAESSGKLKSYKINDIDNIFSAMADYMEASKIGLLGFAVCGAYIGGLDGAWKKGIKRETSAVIMFDTERIIEFTGLMNEDLHSSLNCELRGMIAMALMSVCVTSPQRGKNEGGLHDEYLSLDSYARDFYSIMFRPTIGVIGGSMSLKKVNSKYIFPKILSPDMKRNR